MKLFEKNITTLIRIQFGNSKSLSFSETSVIKVFEIAMKIFRAHKLKRTIVLEDVSPLDPVPRGIKLNIYVREERGRNHERYRPKGAKSKTIYGLTDEEALQIFLDNYKKYLPDENQ